MEQFPTEMRSALILLGVFLIYSCSGIFTKFAGNYPFLSLPYIGLVVGAITILGAYAVLWQKVLESVDLSKAYLYKSVTVLYGLLFAVFIFHETITIANILGLIFIVSGIFLISWNQQ